jgi:hypothetical protein
MSSMTTGRQGGQETAAPDSRISGTKSGDLTDKVLRDHKSPPDDGYCPPRSAGVGTDKEKST